MAIGNGTHVITEHNRSKHGRRSTDEESERDKDTNRGTGRSAHCTRSLDNLHQHHDGHTRLVSELLGGDASNAGSNEWKDELRRLEVKAFQEQLRRNNQNPET